MTGVTCEDCGGIIHEDIDGTSYCDTCGFIRYLDGTVIHGDSYDENKDLDKGCFVKHT